MKTYKPEIDGLRAIAVLSVFLFHLGFNRFSGGFVGVDIFFVISGYLITSIIYKDLEKGIFTFAKFYERRIRRIIPALYFVLLVCVIFTFKFFMINEMQNFCKSLLSSLLFYSNILFWHQSGYFDLDSAMKPLLHTWSLSIEEQFYIFFPGILLLLHKKCRNKIIPVLSLFFAISLALSIAGAEKNQPSAFYFLHSRAWELLLGSLIAIGALPKINGRAINELMCLAGLAMIGYGIFFLNDKSTFPGINAAIPCLGTGLLIYSASNELVKTWVGKVLGSAPFTGIGKISYSLYLWHWPIIVFTKYIVVKKLNWHHQVEIVMIVFILSFLSWKYIEQPFRNKDKLFKNTRSVVTSLGFATLILIVFSIAGGYMSAGFPSRLSPAVLSYANGSNDINPSQQHCHKEGLERAKTSDLCILGEKKEGKPDFVVWGDSHADAFMPAFDLMSEKNHAFGVYASHSACSPLLGVIRTEESIRKNCEKFNEAMISFIEKNSIRNVVLVSRWASNKLMKMDDKVKPKKGEMAAFTLGFNNTLERLKNNHSKIWIVKKIPVTTYDIPSSLGRYAMFGKTTSKLHISYKDFEKSIIPFNTVLDVRIEKYDLHIIDPASLLCSPEKGTCMIEMDGKPLYRDHQHLSLFGATYLSPVLQPFFDDLKNGKPSL